MTDPRVSIVILNHNNPHVIEVCLKTLQITDGVPYETIVVDNGSDRTTVVKLNEFASAGLIDTLVLEKKNHLFAEGNNIGVRNSNPNSEYILLLNSDVAFLRSDWLTKVMEWMEGLPEYKPSVWGFHPTTPSPGPRDIVSVGWSHDANVVPGNARFEGWCIMIRRSVWTDISPDFPWHYGLEEMLSNAIRAGAKCGVLSQYNSYLVHREGGSGRTKDILSVENKRQPDLAGWMSGLPIETLDFTLGPNEHDSYLVW